MKEKEEKEEKKPQKPIEKEEPVVEKFVNPYVFADGDSVTIFDTTPTGRIRRDPAGKGSWQGVDLQTKEIKIKIDGIVKRFPFGTEIEYAR